jgi:low temperature requirement protein LtrA
MRNAVWRVAGAERDVAPIELFFDVVYVFAVGQLSHDLLATWNCRWAPKQRSWRSQSYTPGT